MNTASLTYSSQHLIDTAPLAARYNLLCRSVLTFLAAGQLGRMLRCSRKIVAVVRVFTKLEAQNALLRRKRVMLRNRDWRAQVLRDLGGVRKLKSWEATRARRIIRNAETTHPPDHKRLKYDAPSWHFTPERIAESERLKARARKCMRASVHPNIERDRVKVDFDGLFRLAPLPRGKSLTRQMIVYTQNTIVDYNWNPVPFAKTQGFGPATVWPVEFYAAMRADLECEQSLRSTVPSSRTCISSKTLKRSLISLDAPQMPEPEMDPVISCHKWESEVSVVPLYQALPQKTWRALFEIPI